MYYGSGGTGKSPPRVGNLAGTSAGDEWQYLWSLFDDLERTWHPNTIDANMKVTTLRKLFSMLADLETQLRKRNAEIEGLKDHHVRAVAPILRRLQHNEDMVLPFKCLGAWQVLMMRSKREKLKKAKAEAQESAAKLGHSGEVAEIACQALESKVTGLFLDKVIGAWHSWAWSQKRFAKIGKRCAAAHFASDKQKTATLVASVFGSWRIVAAEGPQERQRAVAVQKQANLQERLRLQRDEAKSLEKALQEMQQHHEVLTRQSAQTRRSLSLWRDLASSTGSGWESVAGEIVSAKQQRNSLQQRSREIKEELQGVVAQIGSSAKRVETAAEVMEGAKRQSGRRSSLGAQQPRASLVGLEDAKRQHEAAAKELNDLHEIETSLQKALWEVEKEIEQVPPDASDSDLLYTELQQAQQYIEATFNRERQTADSLKKGLSQLEFENEQLRSELQGEHLNASTRLAQDKVQIEEEIAAEKKRSEVLERDLKEAKDWIERLKFQNAEVDKDEVEDGEGGLPERRRKPLELTQIKEALQRFADVNDGALRHQPVRDVQRISRRQRTPSPSPVPASTTVAYGNSYMPPISSQPTSYIPPSRTVVSGNGYSPISSHRTAVSGSAQHTVSYSSYQSTSQPTEVEVEIIQKSVPTGPVYANAPPPTGVEPGPWPFKIQGFKEPSLPPPPPPQISFKMEWTPPPSAPSSFALPYGSGFSSGASSGTRRF